MKINCTVASIWRDGGAASPNVSYDVRLPGITTIGITFSFPMFSLFRGPYTVDETPYVGWIFWDKFIYFFQRKRVEEKVESTMTRCREQEILSPLTTTMTTATIWFDFVWLKKLSPLRQTLARRWVKVADAWTNRNVEGSESFICAIGLLALITLSLSLCNARLQQCV